MKILTKFSINYFIDTNLVINIKILNKSYIMYKKKNKFEHSPNLKFNFFSLELNCFNLKVNS